MTHARWAPRLRRFLAGIAGLALLGGAALVPSAQSTDAAWTDAEVGAATFTATTLEAPVIATCDVRTLLNLGLVFTGVTIAWTSPYDASNVQLEINETVVPAANITQSGSGPYTYRASLSASLLQSLLGGLLGSDNAVEVVAVLPGTEWQSVPDTRTLSVGGVLGLLGANECTDP